MIRIKQLPPLSTLEYVCCVLAVIVLMSTVWLLLWWRDEKESLAWEAYSQANSCKAQPRTYNAQSVIFVCKNGDTYSRRIK